MEEFYELHFNDGFKVIVPASTSGSVIRRGVQMDVTVQELRVGDLSTTNCPEYLEDESIILELFAIIAIRKLTAKEKLLHDAGLRD